MIARLLPYEESFGPITGTRSGRNAAHVRRSRSKRLRNAHIARVFATVGLLTVAIVVYLALMANVTRMNYELSKIARAKTTLVDESSRLEDRIARLETRERLAGLASGLHMREAQTFARISLPVERAVPVSRGIAFLTWLK